LWGWGQDAWGWGGDEDNVTGMRWGWGCKFIPVSIFICHVSLFVSRPVYKGSRKIVYLFARDIVSDNCPTIAYN